MSTKIPYLATQNYTVLDELVRARRVGVHEGWVSMPMLAASCGGFAVHSRVADLRKLGWTIANKIRQVDGKRRSWYRLE
jgi:hypothetical protein